MVYRKAMQLSAAEVARMGIGGIANLQSNDVQKMARFRLDINPLWDAPFQASFALDQSRVATWSGRSRLQYLCLRLPATCNNSSRFLTAGSVAVGEVGTCCRCHQGQCTY